MTSDTSPSWVSIGAFALFTLSFLVAVVIGLTVCKSEKYSFVDRAELVDPDADGFPRQGVYFTGRRNDNERLVLYSYRFGCLELEHWRPSAGGDWTRDQRGGAKRTWIKFGPDLRLVEQWECSTQSEVLPRPRAISPRGTRLAWIYQSPDSDDDQRSYLLVADIRDIHAASFDSDAVVAANPVPVQKPYHDLTFMDEERLLLWHGEDRVLTWDTNTETVVADDPLVNGATAFEARGNLIASANFEEGVLGLTRLGSKRVSSLPVLQLLQLDQPGETGRQGKALALGKNGLATLASNHGTFAILGLEGDAPKIKLDDRDLAGFSFPITQAIWIDDKHVVFASELASLQVAKLHLENHGEWMSLEDVYALPLQEIPASMEWTRFDPSTGLFVYGTKDGAFVGRLFPNCERFEWETLATIPVGAAGVLSFLWALLSARRKVRGGKS